MHRGFLFLLVAVGGIAWEAVPRFAHSESVEGVTVIAVGTAGTFNSGFTAWLFLSGRKSNLSVESAFMQMAADAAVSLGVVVTVIVIMLTSWLWLKPLVSLAVGPVILRGA